MDVSADVERGLRLRLLEQAADRISDGVVLMTADLDPPGPRIIYANRAFADLVRVGTGGIEGSTVGQMIGSDRYGQLLRDTRLRLESGRSFSGQTVLKGGPGEGSVVEWEVFPLLDEEGRITHFGGHYRDVTERHLRDEARHGMDLDPVTGLPNRAHFLARLGRAFDWKRETGPFWFALALVEVHVFEEVSERLGTLTGNAFLEALAWRIGDVLGPGDVVARLEEGTLGILLERRGDAPYQVDHIVRRIRAEIETPFTFEHERVECRATIAAVVSRPEHRHPEDMLREVEHSLSRSRTRAGEGVQVVWSGPIDVPGMASELVQAIERDEFSIHYQPVLDLNTREVVGLEALLRWRHPERGLLSSRDFIDGVVQSGLTSRVGHWVMHEVCSQMTRWQTALGGRPVPPVHVNVFPSELRDPAYVTDLGKILRDTGMNPSQLRLEMEMPPSGRIEGASAEAFEFLKQAGVEVWLERFGVGALGVPELRKLPFRRVKLDPGLVSATDPTAEEGRILHALLQLAHELGVAVAAGGIETPAQWDLFRRHHCDLGQGYLLARPQDPLGIFDQFLRA